MLPIRIVGGGTEPIGDCDRTDLGTLYYCGDGSGIREAPVWISTDLETGERLYADGVVVRDFGAWQTTIFGEPPEDCTETFSTFESVKGVFDGVEVVAERSGCRDIVRFGSYLTIKAEGDVIVESPLTGASNCAIYYKAE